MHGLSLHYSCVGFDIDAEHEFEPLLSCDIVFVCVPTPGTPSGRLDCTAVVDVLTTLSERRYKGLVAIKSTLSIGFMEGAGASFPDLRVVYMPEFLRERNRFSWFLDPDRLLISGKSLDVEEALGYFSWAKNARIIKCDHRSAEVGKLAHNAFIATKVSFTNEMEAIASKVGADATIVMTVVSADRRVKSDAHLHPGLGPYNGRCVPKDTAELNSFNKSPSALLSAVQKIRGITPARSGMPDPLRVVVIIPTLNRPEKLKRALASVRVQIHSPDLVVVVSDSDPDNEVANLEAVESLKTSVPAILIRNALTHNLSGAINTGLDYCSKAGFDPQETFLALLDDDDWWDKMYIDNSLALASETTSDWIVSGLIRHDGGDRPRSYLKIPSAISVGDFLVGNPNVQGSNLFVKLSRLLDAGGFDETLESTTDRDICIRLLNLPGIRYEMLRNHLVHHDASDFLTRLSSPGSPRKRNGLNAFYSKYKMQMSSEQDAQFKKRALDLFSVEIQ